MKIFSTSAYALVFFMSLSASLPAFAQKSQDRLRFAFLEATQSVDNYTDPKPENKFLAYGIFDNLIAYDEDAHQYGPLLAKTFKRVDDKTFEFELRDDVVWQDGEKFDADDVVYTINWIVDPATKLRFKSNWDLIAGAEKLGTHKVRVTTKEPTPNAFETLAYETNIYPEHLHKPLADKEAFGVKPIGTGMYRVTQVDRNNGNILIKNKDYKLASAAKPSSNIGRIEIIPVPDEGTQMAHFLRGDIHLVRNTPLEQAQELAKNPQYAMTLAQSISYLYMSFDAAGRSGLKPLQDVRVRKAMLMAINGEEVYRIRAGKHPLPRGVPDALCWKFQEGCDYTARLPAYDPEGAKKLLAEAGYADGFDIQISTFNSTRDMAEVVTGHLRKIGIRASVDGLTFVAYRNKQTDGKLNALVSGWSAGAGPDISRTLNFFFEDGPRDYFRNPRLHELARVGLTTIDESKRKTAVRELMDTTTEMAYAIPVAPIPLVFLHINDLKITGLAYDAFGIRPSDLNWK